MRARFIAALWLLGGCALFDRATATQSQQCTQTPLIMHIASGEAHTCASTSQATYCWGRNLRGETGDDPSLDNGMTLTPVQVNFPQTVSALAGGQDHSCAINAQGQVWCWGSQSFGEAGPTGNPSFDSHTIPMMVEGASATPVVGAIAAGNHYTCVVKSGTTGVSCWGDDTYGTLGVDPLSNPAYGAITDVPNVTAATVVGSGGYHVCAATSSDPILCWGRDDANQLGDSTTTLCNATPCTWTPITPQLPSTFKKPATSIAAGDAHTCVVDGSGVVFCWGDVSFGQTGDVSDTGVGPAQPHAVTGLPPVVAVAASANTTCALGEDQSVWCFGANDHGQLGLGAPDALPHATPQRVQGVTATAITSGAGFVCMVAPCGAVTCLGANDTGQLGDTSTADSLTPANVALPTQ